MTEPLCPGCRRARGRRRRRRNGYGFAVFLVAILQAAQTVWYAHTSVGIPSFHVLLADLGVLLLLLVIFLVVTGPPRV